MNFPPDAQLPAQRFEQSLSVSASECTVGLRASLQALTNRLQEAAGLHARALGVGIQALQENGFTWMLGRLALRLFRRPLWDEPLRLTTWPNGVRGRLMAERQFCLETPSGETLLEASSEWLYVNLHEGRLARLPESVLNLALPGTFSYALCRRRLAPLPNHLSPLAESTFTVRRAEIDANLHVNNVHYTAWMLETLPETLYFSGEPTLLDIEYKQAARLGDTVIARTYPLEDGAFLHTVSRPDGTLLARAETRFAPSN